MVSLCSSEDGSFTQFNERQKEAWLCNDYDYRDPRRAGGPDVHLQRRRITWHSEKYAPIV